VIDSFGANWQWDLWGTCLDLISDFDGTPAGSDYATWVHAHYATLE
jgi:hypothetical protein